MTLGSMSVDLSLPSASGGPEVGQYHGIETGYLVSSAQGVPATSYARQSMSHSHAHPAPETMWEESVSHGIGISVFGEVFRLDRDPDLGLVLQHPKWSLLGYGKTIREAEQLLVERGQALGEIMRDDFPLKLDDEGVRFRDFVIRLLYLRSSPSTPR